MRTLTVASLLAAAHADSVRLRWEPVRWGSYCQNNSDPFQELSAGGGSWPPRPVSDGFVCMTHETGNLECSSCGSRYSPLEFADVASGRIASAWSMANGTETPLATESCGRDDDARTGCKGSVELELGSTNELTLEWVTEDGSDFRLFPPLGDIIVDFALTSNDSACLQQSAISLPLGSASECTAGAAVASGKCCADLPPDYYPIWNSDQASWRETATELLISKGQLVGRIGMYTSFSGALSRFSRVALRCNLATAGACGSKMRWTYAMPPKLDRTSVMRGITLVHPLTYLITSYPPPKGSLDWINYNPLTDEDKLRGRTEIASLSVAPDNSDPCIVLQGQSECSTRSAASGPCEYNSGLCMIRARVNMTPAGGTHAASGHLSVIVNGKQTFAGAPSVGETVITVTRPDGSPLKHQDPVCNGGVCEVRLPAPSEAMVKARARIMWQVCTRASDGLGSVCQDYSFWSQEVSNNYQVRSLGSSGDDDAGCPVCVVFIVLALVCLLCACCALAHYVYKQKQAASASSEPKEVVYNQMADVKPAEGVGKRRDSL